MDTPLISVLMSTYNETTKELDESINSILQQTYSNFEEEDFFKAYCGNNPKSRITQYEKWHPYAEGYNAVWTN